MRVDPAIAALRADRGPQRQAQSAMQQACDDWCSDQAVASALAEFRRFGEGDPLEQCPSLEGIFTGEREADAIVGALSRNFCAGLEQQPLGHPPFRHGYDGRASTLLLARSGRAQLQLIAREPGTYSYTSVSYTDALRYDSTLAGSGHAQILRIHGVSADVRFAEEAIELRRGARLAFDCNSEALLVGQVSRRLVTLRLLQTAATPQPGREYCMKTGTLLKQSAGSLTTSRREMMVALLGRMEREEAAPLLARMALEESDASLRWQCLRECLALETAQGFVTLSSIARNAADPLAGSAGALRAQLIETYPQLRQLEIA